MNFPFAGKPLLISPSPSKPQFPGSALGTEPAHPVALSVEARPPPGAHEPPPLSVTELRSPRQTRSGSVAARAERGNLSVWERGMPGCAFTASLVVLFYCNFLANTYTPWMRPFGAQSSPSTSCSEIKNPGKTPLPDPKPGGAGHTKASAGRAQLVARFPASQPPGGAAHCPAAGRAGRVRDPRHRAQSQARANAGRGAEGGLSDDPGGRDEGEEEQEAVLFAPTNFIGLKFPLLSLPLACGAGLCVRGFWKVLGSGHILGRFSRHLTRRGGGAEAQGGVPAATTLGGARTAAPRLAGEADAPTTLSGGGSGRCERERGTLPSKGKLEVLGAPVASPAGCALPYWLVQSIFKPLGRKVFSVRLGKGRARGRVGCMVVDQGGLVSPRLWDPQVSI